jgi:hypothetical protein
MALVEWWILANSHWLISHAGTSYSDSAAGWGLGPKGVMERLDVVLFDILFSLHIFNIISSDSIKLWTVVNVSKRLVW